MADRDARDFLSEFLETRGPDPQRKRHNWNATLARLDEDPLVDVPAPARASAVRTWVVAAAAVVLIAAAAWRGRALLEPTEMPRAEASASEASPPEPLVAPVRTTVPVIEPVPTTSTPPQTESQQDHDAPSPMETQRRRGRNGMREPASVAPVVETPAAVVTPERLALETRLIARARAAAAKHDDAAAIALLQQHAREFPDGAMVEDRRAWLAIVQCRLGAPAGRQSAASFLAAHPRSPYAERVRVACDEPRKIE